MLFKLLDKTVKGLLIFLFVSMVVIGFMQIFFRYVLGNSLSWSEESIRYMFVWATFLGVPVGVDRGLHASFDILARRLPANYKLPYEIFLLLLTGVVFAILAYIGFPYAFKNIRQLTPALRIPYTYVILAVPVGSIVGILYVGHCIAKLFRKEEGQA